METTDKKGNMRPEKELTQEEKKSQRAAKAAEKKARAEAAAAKKAQTAGNPQHQKQQKEPKANNQKEEKLESASVQKTAKEAMEHLGQVSRATNEAVEQVSKAMEKVVEHISKAMENVKVGDKRSPSSTKAQRNSTSTKEVKSALKSNQDSHSYQGNGKEVQFDLTATETDVVRTSESEDAIIADPPVVPLEDASTHEHVHPSFLALLARCEKHVVSDIEQLCQEFICAFREFLHEWATTKQRENADPSALGHDLDLAIRPQLAHLTQSGRWPLPYALGNIVRQMKCEIVKMDGKRTALFNSNKDPISAQIEVLDEWLEDSLRINFTTAYDAITLHLRPKLKNTRCVLTYGWCPVVNHVLLSALETYSHLNVCVVDPELNGKGIRHVESLTAVGHRCQYTDLKSIGYAVSKCSMVLLGCSAILSNGCVATTKGTIQLALAAKAFNVPVLIASQSFKYVDKVQTYSRTALLERENVELLPSTLVTAVVTDIRILPPTAAPAVLKAKALDLE